MSLLINWNETESKLSSSVTPAAFQGPAVRPYWTGHLTEQAHHPSGSIGWPCLIEHPSQVLQFCGFIDTDLDFCFCFFFFGSCCWWALLKRILSWSLNWVGKRTKSILGMDRRGMSGASHVCTLTQGPGLSLHSAHHFPPGWVPGVPSSSSPCQPEWAQTPQHRLWHCCLSPGF